MVRFYPILLILFGLVWLAGAHNGAVAIAVPVEGITIDGDLSDWPEGMREYPIRIVTQGGDPAGDDDFSARFQVAYSAAEHSLYVGVAVEDDYVLAHQPEATAAKYKDGCEIYIEVGHEGEYASVLRYYMHGNTLAVDGLAQEKDVQVAVQWGENAYFYEWKIKLDLDKKDPFLLDAGLVLGFNVALLDRDADNALTKMIWNQRRFKFTRYSFHWGDLVLAGENLGTLEGNIQWPGQRGGVGYTMLQAQSLDHPAFSVHGRTDANGHFVFELPAGDYRLQPDINLDGDRAVKVKVEAHASAALQLTAKMPRGRSVEAGVGKRIPAGEGIKKRAGRGQWQDHWLNISLEDGLPDPSVGALLQDKEGYIWIGSKGGISRYDGQEFVTYTDADGLSGNSVSCILEDLQGDLWIASGDLNIGHTFDKGVSIYDGHSFLTLSEEDGLLSNNVMAMLQDQDGNLWFGTERGVSRYDGHEFTNFTTADGLPDSVVTSILQDSSGALWFGTLRGVIKYEEEKITTYNVQANLSYDQVRPILEDREGNLWFGTGGHELLGTGLFRFGGRDIKTYTIEDGLSHMGVMSIGEDSQGNLWFGTWWGGVNRFDGKEFKQIEGLPNHVWSIAEDHEGNLWFASLTEGVFKYDGHEITRFTNANGLAGKTSVEVKVDRRGNVWFATDGGLIRYDGSEFVHFTTADGLSHNNVLHLMEDRDGILWIGTFGGGVSRYDGAVFQSLSMRDGLSNNAVQETLQDRNGHIWMATEGGITRYSPRRTPPSIQVVNVTADAGSSRDVH
jgi:ligand-binding sensor domain-containing protein